MDKERVIFIAVIGSVVSIIMFVALLVFFVIYQRKKAQQLADANRHREELLHTQLEIQQQTLHNISQEIHDHTGQMLSLIKLNLGRAMRQGGEQYPAHAIVTETLDIADKVMNDLRHLSKGLNADFVQQLGLAGCLQYELERLQNTGQYQTQLITEGTAAEPPLNKAFVLYRVVQECLNNIIKHARATAVTINLQYKSTELQITVADNGRGFDAAVPAASGTMNGLGLRNMHSRMALIGGRFECETLPGRGTRCVLAAPASAD